MEWSISLLESPYCSNLLFALLHSLWQGPFIAALLYVFLRVDFPKSENARYKAGLIAMAAIVLCVLFTFSILNFQSDLTTETSAFDGVKKQEDTVAIESLKNIVQTESIEVRSVSKKPLKTSTLSAGRADLDWKPLALALWFVGVVIMLLRAMYLITGGAKLRSGCNALKDERILAIVERLRERMKITRKIRIAVSDQISIPGVIGFVRAVLFLPASMLSGMPADALEAILAHELAHIKRYDYLVNFCQIIIEAILFFNPAMWWISRQIRIEREMCCDNAGIAAIGRRIRYAEVLIGWAKKLQQPEMEESVAAMGFGKPDSNGSMAERIKRIITTDHKPALKASWHFAGITLLLCFIAVGSIYLGADLSVAVAGKILSPEEATNENLQAQADNSASELERGKIQTSDSPSPLLQVDTLILKEATNIPLSYNEEAVIINVNKGGQVFISDYEVQADSLREKLLEIFEGRESREVFLNADKSAPYGVVTRVISEIKAAGIEKLGMVTELEAATSTFSEPKEEVLLVSSEPIAEGAGESASASNAASNAQSDIDLNMVDTDITVLIETISRITGKTFIIDNNVKGKVNVVSPEKITKEEAYKLFQSVLEVNEYALVPSGNVIKVVPASEARTKSTEVKGLRIVTDPEANSGDLKAATNKDAGQLSTEQGLVETELYNSGKQAFDNGQYEIALERFEKFLAQYPESGNADNAQFWSGEIYYRGERYEEAIMEYQKVIENYRGSNKVPASLLKQGLSFFKMGQEPNARTFLEHVVNNYPTSSEAKIAREKLGMLTDPEAAAGDSKAVTGMTGKEKSISDIERIYYAEVASNIKRNWTFSDQMTGGEKDLYNEVVIEIQRNGTIEEIWFERRSGNSHLDDSTYKAILKSTPLPPIPDGISGPSLTLGFRFVPKGLGAGTNARIYLPEVTSNDPTSNEAEFARENLGMRSDPEVDITDPGFKKTPIAVPVFKTMTNSSHEQKICEEASELLSDDLEFSGYFKLIDRGAFLENPESMGIIKENIQFKNWTVIGAEYLVTGGVQVSGDQLIIELRTFDTLKQTLVAGLGKRYVAKLEDNELRKIIQRYCSEVVFQLFGERDIFTSKIDSES